MVSFNPNERADHDDEANLEPYGSSELEADPDDVPVSVQSSLDWDAVSNTRNHLLGCASSGSCSWCSGHGTQGNILGILFIIGSRNHPTRLGYRLGFSP